MNYRLLFFGLFFLFNPELTIIDFLPDAIGFLLIARSLKPMADASPSAESAMRAFYKLSILHAIKIAAIIPMASVTVDEPSFAMLFTLAFAALSLFFLFPAFENFFASLDYFSSRQGRRIPHVGFVKGLLLLSFLVRYVLAFLPESVYLYIDNNNVYDAAIYPLHSYRSGLMFVSFSLSFLLGLIEYLITIRFFSKLKKDIAFNSAIREEMGAVHHTRAQIAMRSIVPTLRMLTFLGLSMITVTLDGITIFPSCVTPLMLLLLYRFVKPLTTVTKKAVSLTVLALITGIASNLINLIFRVLYGEKATVGLVMAKQRFLFPLAMEAIFTVFLILSLIPLIKLLSVIINDYTGTVWESAYISHNSATAKERASMQFRAKLAVSFAIAMAITNLLSYAFLYEIPEIRLINAALGLAFAVFTGMLSSAILQAAKEKYAELKEHDVA